MKRETSSDVLWNLLVSSSSTRTAVAPVSGCESAHSENEPPLPSDGQRRKNENVVEINH
jgi:hypothetical protein